ncbi:MAG TPA: hypothetical protein VM074_04790 [Solimonas sp.]|nr:hypothetical protein [Solimonas sp.]
MDLPDLENLRIADNGRVFVSGQQNLYEITRDGSGAYSATALLGAGSGCSGMAFNGGTLYALCPGQSDPTDLAGLFALDVATPGATPQQVYSLAGMSLPNGMAWDEVGGYLYVTDGPIAAEPKIVRLKVDAADPRHIVSQETWLALLPQYPNGLALRGRSLYTTLYQPGSGGTVARVDIQADGTPAAPVAIYAGGIMDDLSVAGDTLLVTDWQGGAIFQIGLDGTLLQTTDPLSFSQPSTVELASGPLFAPGDVLVTERYTGRGLWVFSPAR